MLNLDVRVIATSGEESEKENIQTPLYLGAGISRRYSEPRIKYICTRKQIELIATLAFILWLARIVHGFMPCSSSVFSILYLTPCANSTAER